MAGDGQARGGAAAHLPDLRPRAGCRQLRHRATSPPNEEAQAQATYSALLPEADHFSELSTTVDGVTNVLKADNGAGYIVVAAARGYKGDVVATVAFDNDGSILDLSMTAADETVGIGTKVTEEDFTGQFSGMPAENFAYGDVDAVSNATYSSKAAVEAINLAIQAYQEVRGN